MSEPQAPPPPPAPPATPAPAKKKVSPWIWVLGGCLVLIVIVLLLMGACTWFVADKVKEGVEEFEANPGAAVKTAAEMAVRLNPDLELVSTNDEEGTMTVREKSTGEEVTLDFDEIVQGRFSFETEEGESSISFDPQSEGGVTFEGPDGTTTFGGGAGNELPAWIELYPGSSEPQGAYSSTTGDQRAGAVSSRSTDPVARVLEFYERTLKAAGLEVSKTTFTAQGSDGGMLNGSSDEPQRTVTVMVSEEDGETVISINYSEPAG
jgi:hypothetical protein